MSYVLTKIKEKQGGQTMQEVKREISEELYKEYKAMSRSQFLKTIDEHIPMSWRYGYGHYGARLAKIDGKYYVIHTIGDTCD
jgi:hypothetical protein